jgi:hypothetical protein
LFELRVLRGKKKLGRFAVWICFCVCYSHYALWIVLFCVLLLCVCVVCWCWCWCCCMLYIQYSIFCILYNVQRITYSVYHLCCVCVQLLLVPMPVCSHSHAQLQYVHHVPQKYACLTKPLRNRLRRKLHWFLRVASSSKVADTTGLNYS